jgi:FlaA1/EpsC-like NDP-sugar epimerase
MSRFFFTHDDVSDLIFQALTLGQGGEVFVSKMPAVWLEDLAEAMVEILAPEYGYNVSEIDIIVGDRRFGERSYEEIFTKAQATSAFSNESPYVIQSEMESSNCEQINNLKSASEMTLSSNDMRKTSKDAIISSLMKAEYPIGL